MNVKGKLYKLLFFEFLLLLSTAYVLYLALIYPNLVPNIGLGKAILLNDHNNYTASLHIVGVRTRMWLTITSDNEFAVQLNSLRWEGNRSVVIPIEPLSRYELTIKCNAESVVKVKGNAEVPLQELFIASLVLLLSLVALFRAYVDLKESLRLIKRPSG